MTQVIHAPTIATSAQQYRDFQQKRARLLDLIEQQLSVTNALDMGGRQDVLNRLAERIQADNFKVLVLGEFKRGKSTFINAMLGEEILPAYARPTTAIINEVKWGDSPQALLHHSKSQKGSVRPPQEVPVQQLEEYVTIQRGSAESDAIHENPYDKVELLWPLDLCKNGVEIIDSPGLNEHEIRQKVTMDYLSTVDAVLFVLSCEALASQSEVEVIDNTLRNMGHEDLFFICNRFNMIRPKEKEDIRQHAFSRLAHRTNRGEDGVFFIDALGALDGRLAGNAEQVERSGVPQLEQALAQFLSTERGRVKILRPAIELRNAIQEARRIIPERTAMLRTDVNTLEARYQEAQAPLRQLEMKRKQMIARLAQFREDTSIVVSDRAKAFYDKLAEETPQWAQEYELQNSVKVPTKAQIERAVGELVEHLSQRVESEFSNWQRSELQPLITERLESRKEELSLKAGEFVEQLDELRLQVSGMAAPALSEQDIGQRKVSPLERILSAAGGLVVGGLGSAGIGAVYGYEEMLKSLMPQILIGAATLFFVGFNPWVLIPVMASGGVIQGILSNQSTNNKLKQVIGKNYAQEINARRYEQAAQLASTVATELQKFEEAVDSGLNQEIESVSEQVNSVLEEKQKGKANVDRKLQELDSVSNSLNQIDSKLDELIAQVALS